MVEVRKHIHKGDQFWTNKIYKKVSEIGWSDIHREDGPAVIRADGSEEWFLFGKRHRIGGPAFVDANGSEAWYMHGECHREDGPAMMYPDGYMRWFYYGRDYSFDSWLQALNISAEEKAILKLKYG